jgi:hypothetical protein
LRKILGENRLDKAKGQHGLENQKETSQLVLSLGE